jgi:hypothetical protein
MGRSLLALALISGALLAVPARGDDAPTAPKRGPLLPVMEVRRYYGGQAVPKLPVRVKPAMTPDGWVAYRLRLRSDAYRDTKCAKATFRVPKLFRRSLARLRVEARSTDRTRTRVLYLDLDGKGGYLEVSPVKGSPGQQHGKGVLTAGALLRRLWPLGRMPFSPLKKMTDLQRVLDHRADHTLTTWISTYAKWGKGSQVMVDIEFRLEM